MRKFSLIWSPVVVLIAGTLAVLLMRPSGAQKRADEADFGAGRIEMMEVTPASKIVRGLGFNLNYLNEWEFARAKEAGATEARMQFDWPSVERARGQLKLTPQMARALDLCAQNGLEPLVIAAYAPLATPLGDLTTSADVPADSTQIPVRGTSLGDINPPFCHVMGEGKTQIVAEGRWAYYGALIDAVDARKGTIRLASKTDRALPAGTILRVNRLLYPSVATQEADDPSLIAYDRYARFLAREIAARGLKGRVELWNEPPWIHDRWDARSGFYDAAPREITAGSPNPGMLDGFLNGEAAPDGVSFVWGGSHKSGGRGLGARRDKLSASQLRNVSADAIHPYGDAPETHAWNPQALRDGAPFSDLALEGTNVGSNFKILRQNQVAAARRGDLAPQIIASEIGHQGADETQKTRYNLRAFLIYLSLGVERVNFYKLADRTGKFGFIEQESQARKPAFRAFSSFMAQVKSLGANSGNVAAFDSQNTPSVTAYDGQFPLTVIPIAARNRWLMVTYQRTFARAPQKWDMVPSPASAQVTMRVPAGFRVQSLTNLVSGAAIEFQNSPVSLTYGVSDDPIAVEMSSALPQSRGMESSSVKPVRKPVVIARTASARTASARTASARTASARPQKSGAVAKVISAQRIATNARKKTPQVASRRASAAKRRPKSAH